MSDEKSLDNADEACEWASDVLSMTDVWGGYPGPYEIFDDYAFVVDPGNESPKYCQIYRFKLSDLVDVYQKYNSYVDEPPEALHLLHEIDHS